jgi:thioredoxin-dependent peroxiredoxin
VLPDFSKVGLQVIGVSPDSLESHEAFAKKYKLAFPLASDETGEVAKIFRVIKEKSKDGAPYFGVERSTFLVGGDGVLRKMWRNVSVFDHILEVKRAISDL